MLLLRGKKARGNWGSTPDITPPILSSPSGIATSDTTAELDVTTNEGNGILYWVVSTSSTAPTPTQIKAGQDHTGAAAADADSINISEPGNLPALADTLTAATGYCAHFYHEDAALNGSNIVTSAEFTTSAAGALAITGTPPDAQLGTAYSFTPTVTGGTPPYTYAVSSGALPSWASLNTSTGEITGVPV